MTARIRDDLPRQPDLTDEDREQLRFLKRLPDEFVECRKWRHPWAKTSRGTLYDLNSGQLRGLRARILVCEVCGTQRWDVLNSWDAHPIYRRYVYAEGYENKENGRISAANVELEARRRAKVQPIANAMRAEDREELFTTLRRILGVS